MPDAAVPDLAPSRAYVELARFHHAEPTKICTDVLQAEGVGVTIEAQHLCMMMRGVEKQNSMMTTSAMLGSFRNSAATRTEFLTLIGRHRP